MSAIQDLAIQAQGYQELYNQGKLTAEEYKELVNDMNIVGQINADSEQLEQNDQYHAILMGALQLAEALA
jgi:polyhydroxyalkanoate synthesis regulator phasin